MENIVANSQATIVDITVENFQQIIIEASQEKLVLIDFWADWCEPCKDLMPILEKLAGEYKDHLILAKVDCEAQQEVAAQFGIRSLPTVMVVQNGQPVDGFAGVQPEQQIREMLAKYLPNPEDDLLATAGKAIQQGDYAEALPAAKEALELNPDNVNAKYMLIDCFIETGSIDAAKSLLEEIKLVDQDSRYRSLAGKIELAEQAADTPEIRQLTQAVEANPDDLQLKVDLAVQLQQANKAQDALELLYCVLKKELGFGDARKLMMDMMNALPDGDPLKSEYRRKVYSLLY
ncbi:co-chaperone YbbN [Alteromonas sp. KUL42]|uniref:thioredoxin n=1 Tax=Alteromonas sp. KUL42 TaxID=2480797 RepID=UPI00079A2695|nr:thioredoxin [Alteromonas sp. KUL42]KXJ59690.1 MAG: co-chaperone YbbN [Alteromonas sp. Nap_26]TAP31800.1 thioredoxin [Alteromonas sp. KUL42]GEA09217.1 co-chaperone YbbN [Alteromonas sp. KUL42]